MLFPPRVQLETKTVFATIIHYIDPPFDGKGNQTINPRVRLEDGREGILLPSV